MGIETVETIMLKIYLFGRPRIGVADRSGELAIQPSSLRLLAYLLVRRGTVGRQNAAFALWPDDPEDVALGKLRRHLYNLRSALESTEGDTAWITADDSVIHLKVDRLWVDAKEFEALSCQSDGSAAAADLYAADLYAADLLENYDDEWVIVERDRLRSLAVSNLAKLTAACRSKREFEPAIRFAARLLDLEPWREDVVRLMIKLRYEAGDRSGAFNEYERFASRLREDMGIEPMPETRALMIAVSRNDTVAEEADRSRRDDAVIRSRPTGAFVGRRSEMEFLSSRWGRAAIGSGGGLFIAGESGIGKTRLAHEFAAGVESQGGRVLFGLTSAPESRPFQALADALRGALPMLGAVDAEPIWLSVLAQLVPDIRVQRAALPMLTPLENDREQARLFDAVASCLEALCRSRPLAIVLEDLHWAGATSIAAVEFLMRRAASRKILVIATYRTEEISVEHPLAAIRRRLLRDGNASQLEPSRLTREAIRELAALSPELRPLNASAQHLYDASEGNPLLAVQTITSILESGDAQAALASARSDAAESLDAAIRRTVAGRIARLSPAARSVAEVAAVIGVGFDVEMIEEVTGWQTTETLNALGELLDRRLVREGVGGLDYAFAHHLIQSSIYARIPEHDRRRRHHRIARVRERMLGADGPELAGSIALHYERAGDKKVAGAYYITAARSASAVFAHEEAVALSTRAFEFAEDDRARFEALRLRADCHKHLGERSGQRADIELMHRIARALGDAELTCSVLSEQINVSHELNDYVSEQRLTDELRQIALENHSERWLAYAAKAQAVYLMTSGDYAGAKANLEIMLAWCTQSNDAQSTFECLILLADIPRRQRDTSQMQTYLEKLRNFAELQQSRTMSLRVLEVEARIAEINRDYIDCKRLAKDWLTEAQAINDIKTQAEALSLLLLAEGRLREYDEAQRHAEIATSLYNRLGDRVGEATVLRGLSLALIQAGRLEAAKDFIQRAVGIFAGIKDLNGQIDSLLTLGYVDGYLGDYRACLLSSLQAGRLARRSGSPRLRAMATTNMSHAERELGKLDSSLRHAEEAVRMDRRLRVPPVLRAAGLANYSQTLLRVGEYDAARRRIEEAIGLLNDRTTVGMAFHHDLYFFAARAYRALGDANRSQSLLQKARSELAKAAAGVSDPAEKTAYLRRPYNLEITEAFERDAWPAEGPHPGDRLPKNRRPSAVLEHVP